MRGPSRTSSSNSSHQSNSSNGGTTTGRTPVEAASCDLEAAAAAQVAARAAATSYDAQPGPLTATAAAAAAVGLVRSASDEPGTSSGEKLPGALAGANSVLQDLHPSLLPLVIAKSTTRKGKGGRQPAADPRLDPGMDPKKARRILANRQSAARSKLKQKLVMEGLKAKHDVLMCQKQEVAKQLRALRSALKEVEAENGRLEEAVQGAVRATSSPRLPPTAPMNQRQHQHHHTGGRCTPGVSAFGACVALPGAVHAPNGGLRWGAPTAGAGGGGGAPPTFFPPTAWIDHHMATC